MPFKEVGTDPNRRPQTPTTAHATKTSPSGKARASRKDHAGPSAEDTLEHAGPHQPTAMRYNLRDRSPVGAAGAANTVSHVRDVEPQLWAEADHVVAALRIQTQLRAWPSFAEGEVIDHVEKARLTLLQRPDFTTGLLLATAAPAS